MWSGRLADKVFLRKFQNPITYIIGIDNIVPSMGIDYEAITRSMCTPGLKFLVFMCVQPQN